MAKPEIDMMEAMRGTTLRIRVIRVREFRFRIWLGLHVMRLAAVIIGTTIELEVVEQ